MLFVLGAVCVHVQAVLPLGPGASMWVIAAATPLVVAATMLNVARIRGYPKGAIGRLITVLRIAILGLSTFAIGVAYVTDQAHRRLADRLEDRHHDAVTRLNVLVDSLPVDGDTSRRVDVTVLPDQVSGIPQRLRVSWYAPPTGIAALPELVPGEVWRMALLLRRPHAAINPHLRDGEAAMFAQGIRALGTVRGRPQRIDVRPWESAAVVVARARHHIRERMRAAIGDRRYGGVLIALAIGDQAGVAREDWDVFNRSGITHLVSISGMHVTLMAGLVAAAAGWLWRRARWRRVGFCEIVPARQVMALAALVLACGYCLLAGWGIPAQRTFFMLAVLGSATLAGVPLSTSRALALAAVAVVIGDPWATLSTGFWLSFGAVAVLLRVASGTPIARLASKETWRDRMRQFGVRWRQAAHVQGMITLGLMPPLAILIHQVSLVSPLANAVAIPVVSLLVTPLALAVAVLSVMPGMNLFASAAGWAAHLLFEWAMIPVAALASSSWSAVGIAAAPTWAAVLALVGVGYATLPQGWPARHWAWLLMTPLLFARPERPEEGDWRMTALDVGQGAAIVIETATATTLYDVGPKHRNGTDAGERVLVPYLRARGIRRIDHLVVSHADLDHAGGLRAVLKSVAVDTAYASFDLAKQVAREDAEAQLSSAAPTSLPVNIEPCLAGKAWNQYGVRFRFIHPQPPGDSGARRRKVDGNAESCVLVIEGRHHRAVLPGDIGIAQERRLLEVGQVDVVLAGHHGSATSSSREWTEALRPSQVIVQAGNLNRFRHPANVVVNRWRRVGAHVARTDRDGAITVMSSEAGLIAVAERTVAPRYWR
ncbi:MAG: DNA internalization-related competence protein ComEC/Rec2 [Achromobacter sp.]